MPPTAPGSVPNVVFSPQYVTTAPSSVFTWAHQPAPPPISYLTSPDPQWPVHGRESSDSIQSLSAMSNSSTNPSSCSAPPAAFVGDSQPNSETEAEYICDLAPSPPPLPQALLYSDLSKTGTKLCAIHFSQMIAEQQSLRSDVMALSSQVQQLQGLLSTALRALKEQKEHELFTDQPANTAHSKQHIEVDENEDVDYEADYLVPQPAPSAPAYAEFVPPDVMYGGFGGSFTSPPVPPIGHLLFLTTRVKNKGENSELNEFDLYHHDGIRRAHIFDKRHERAVPYEILRDQQGKLLFWLPHLAPVAIPIGHYRTRSCVDKTAEAATELRLALYNIGIHLTREKVILGISRRETVTDETGHPFHQIVPGNEEFIVAKVSGGAGKPVRKIVSHQPDDANEGHSGEKGNGHSGESKSGTTNKGRSQASGSSTGSNNTSSGSGNKSKRKACTLSAFDWPNTRVWEQVHEILRYPSQGSSVPTELDFRLWSDRSLTEATHVTRIDHSSALASTFVLEMLPIGQSAPKRLHPAIVSQFVDRESGKTYCWELRFILSFDFVSSVTSKAVACKAHPSRIILRLQQKTQQNEWGRLVVRGQSNSPYTDSSVYFVSADQIEEYESDSFEPSRQNGSCLDISRALKRATSLQRNCLEALLRAEESTEVTEWCLVNADNQVFDLFPQLLPSDSPQGLASPPNQPRLEGALGVRLPFSGSDPKLTPRNPHRAALAASRIPPRTNDSEVKLVDALPIEEKSPDDLKEAERLHSLGKYSEAAPLFERAANSGDPEAQGWLSRYLQHGGWSLARSDARAFSLARQSAQKGNAMGLFALGRCYAVGIGVERNDQTAVEYYRRAADLGNALSQHNLGVCYETGVGVPKNERKAVEYYRLAASQGLSVSQHNLGVCFANGAGVAKDDYQAVRFYQLAAAQSHVISRHNLGVCYANGTGVGKDERRAVELYKLAAAQSYAPSQYNLGVCYATGTGVPKDAFKAVELYELAVSQGNAPAQEALAGCYKNGFGVQQDFVAAVRLYRLAADQGNPSAQKELGFCYAQGIGVQQDDQQAIKYYQLAAEQGNVAAINNLATFYFKGVGVAKDPSKALEFFRRAAELGCREAQYNLNLCLNQNVMAQNNQQVAVDTAMGYYQLARAASAHLRAAHSSLQSSVAAAQSSIQNSVAAAQTSLQSVSAKDKMDPVQVQELTTLFLQV